MSPEILIGKAWLDGLQPSGEVSGSQARARLRLIKILARLKIQPFTFLGILKNAGYPEIAAGMVALLGPVSEPPKRERLDQMIFGFAEVQDSDDPGSI